MSEQGSLVHVVLTGDRAETRGLAAYGQSEISVAGFPSDLAAQAKKFLEGLARSIVKGDFVIDDGTTIQCGFWPVRFEKTHLGALAAQEPDAGNNVWVSGANHALRLWMDQLKMCREVGSEFDPPRPKALTACTAGVLDSEEPVSGVRYRYTDNRSGWFLSTRLYDTNPDAVQMVHTYHVVATRPEVAKFLALASGFSFDQSAAKAWLDKELLSEQPW